jgi:hypothetical protein
MLNRFVHSSTTFFLISISGFNNQNTSLQGCMEDHPEPARIQSLGNNYTWTLGLLVISQCYEPFAFEQLLYVLENN